MGLLTRNHSWDLDFDDRNEMAWVEDARGSEALGRNWWWCWHFRPFLLYLSAKRRRVLLKLRVDALSPHYFIIVDLCVHCKEWASCRMIQEDFAMFETKMWNTSAVDGMSWPAAKSPISADVITVCLGCLTGFLEKVGANLNDNKSIGIAVIWNIVDRLLLNII